MGFGPAYGTGRGGGAVDIFTKKDGNPAIFANTGARDTYFTTNPDELAKVKSSGNAVAIGTTDQVTAAYVYKGSAWQAIATNFKGDKGAPGAPGDGIDYSHLKDNQLPKWDSKTKMFISSGVRSLEDGSISLEPASMHLGSHTISSSAENVTFTNIVTRKTYSPLWQEVAPGAKTGYIRAHGEYQDVILGADGSVDLLNPSFIYTAPTDASIFGATIELSRDATNVEIHVEFNNEELWLARLGDLSAGERKILFSNPADFKMGNNYRVIIDSSDGSEVILKGSNFNTPKATLHAAKWEDRVVTSMREGALETGDVPVWSEKENEFIKNSLSVTPAGGLEVSADGVKLGTTKVTSSSSGLTFNSDLDLYSYKPIVQAVEEDSTAVYSRIYKDSEDFEVNTTIGKEIVSPIVSYTPTENVTLTALKIHLSKDASVLRVSIFQGLREVSTLVETNVSAGQHILQLEDYPDLKANTEYRLAFTGTNKDGTTDFKLVGDSLPYLVISTIPWSGHELASRSWVSDQIKAVAHGTDKFLVERTASPTYYVPADKAFEQRTTFIYSGVENGRFILPDISNPANHPGGSLLLLKNESSTSSPLTVITSAGAGLNTRSVTSASVPFSHVMLFIADISNNIWIMLPLVGGGTGGQTLDTDKVVKNVGTSVSGNQLVITYYDDSSITLDFDPWVDDITKLNTAVASFEKQLKSRTRFYIYKGDNSTPPDFPRGNRGGYYLTFYGLSSVADVTLPTGARDGTILFLDNDSTSYPVSATAGQGETIATQSKITIVPESTAWYVKSGTNWQELYSGYLPASHKKLIDEIKTLISASNTFMRDVGVQGDDPNAGKVECTELEFHKCKVTQDTTVPTKGIVKFEGTTFVNPDGSEITTDKIKLVGMELVDPLDGTPPKLLLHGSGNLPTPHPTSGYGFFSDSATAPDTINLNSLPVFRNGRVSIHKDTADPQYAYILLPPGEGADADRIGELGGLPSYWAKSEKIYNIGGVSRTYTVFRSPYPFKEQDVTLIIYH
ncbi:hypothetical protein PONTUS_140 [Vibrio phage Pontus]|uniref:Uncharacterized protein n=1 Tax=Vibrio phage Pontus TaxID=2590874 RepID=A0A4Y6EA19_9CAUD|nr:hypothetical protein KNU59_gp163 [Vibrio phage Pontus]QDF14765.1 hypothetical protein PONTUS_140 [Vibrio phage Pontus]